MNQNKEITVLFDHQAFEMQKFGGISRYFYELIGNLPVHSELSLRLTTNHYLQEGNCSSFQGLHIPERPYKWFKGIIKQWNREGSIKKLHQADYDLFHPTYYHPYFLDKLPSDKPYVITVHDMNHELFSTSIGRAEQMKNWKRETILKASRIIAISEQTKADLLRFLPVEEEKVDVIYHGIQQQKRPYNGLHLPERYILYVGDRNGYKNFDRFWHVFVRLATEDKKLYLICTGKPWKKQERERIEKSGLSKRVLHFQANDLELGQLFQQAHLFVYPSLYEGFGIPILEAFLNECPVALSRSSCFPEVAAEAGEYFDPENETSIYVALSHLLNDDECRQELILAGKERVKDFTWEKTARKTFQTYQKALQ